MEEDPLILQRFGNEVRRARHAAGLTQEKLAERCGMDLTNLQRIESGRYNTKLISLIRLRESLDVDWDDLLP